MRLSRTHLVPVLAIVGGGLIGASLSFSFLGRSADDDVWLVVPRLNFEYAVTVESATRVPAGVGTVTGKVTDAQTGISIAAVQVYISSLGMGGLSQQNGRYLLQDVPAGTYTLAVTRIGYRTTQVEITVARDQAVEQNFAISEEALQLNGVVVTGTPGRTQRRVINIRRLSSITPDNLERTQPRIVAGRSEPVFTPMTVRPEIRNLDEVQEALMREYPSLLRDDGIGGQVEVWFFVSEEGRVLDSRISQSSGHAPLDEAALKVADVFRFTPARNREQRVAVWIRLPIVFEAQN